MSGPSDKEIKDVLDRMVREGLLESWVDENGETKYRRTALGEATHNARENKRNNSSN